jgi:hypothetical protein
MRVLLKIFSSQGNSLKLATKNLFRGRGVAWPILLA